MITRGTYCNPLRSLRKNRFAAFLLRRLCDAYVEYIAVLVHGPPKIMRFPVDLQVHFIQVPFVSTTRATTTQFIGIRLPKFQTPLSNRFIGDDDSALGQKLFNITKTEREAEIQPDCVANDFRRKAETFVVESNSVCFHEAILAYLFSYIAKLTIPSRLQSVR